MTTLCLSRRLVGPYGWGRWSTPKSFGMSGPDLKLHRCRFLGLWNHLRCRPELIMLSISATCATETDREKSGGENNTNKKIALRLSFCLGLVFEGTCANMGTCLVHRRGWRDFHRRRGTFMLGLRPCGNYRVTAADAENPIRANTKPATSVEPTKRSTSPRSSKTRLW